MQLHVMHRGGLGRCLHRSAAQPRLPSARPALPTLRLRASAPQRVAEEAVPEETDVSSPFLEPLVRSFLLGIGAGVLFESGHVFFKFLGLALEAGTHDLMESVAHHIEAFSPLFVWDHVAALGCWVLLYIVEAIAIVSVLDRYPDDSQKAATTIRSMVTLPKRMLPVRLTDVKRAMYAAVAGKQRGSLAAPPSSAAPAATPSRPVAAAATVLDSPAAPLAFVDAPVADAVGDITARARAPLPKVPQLPEERALRPPPPAAGTRPASDALRQRRAQKQLRPGQLDPDSLFNRRQQEVVDRRAYLRNFWYAAALSESIPSGRPTGVDLLGSRVMLFRDPDQGGKVMALDDFCPHRGAPLSKGWLTKEKHTGKTCCVCPYHGWSFDGEGHVRDMPSAEPGRWPKRQLLSSYPVQEAGGFVWLFFGDKGLPAEERPPLPTVPALSAPGWHVVQGELAFEANHAAVFDNALSVGALQAALGGRDSPGGAGEVEVERDTWGVTTRFTIPVSPASPLWGWSGGEAVGVTATALLPSCASITLDLGGGATLGAFIATTPLSEGRSINRFSLLRNFDGGEGFDAWARRALFSLLGEDRHTLEAAAAAAAASTDGEEAAPSGASSPSWMPGSLGTVRRGRGSSGSTDAGLATRAAFRSLRQEWLELGYGAPPESVAHRRTLADQ